MGSDGNENYKIKSDKHLIEHFSLNCYFSSQTRQRGFCSSRIFFFVSGNGLLAGQ